MKAKTVEELLVYLDLSQEEKERHAELIQECLDRERKLLVLRKQSEERLRMVSGHIQTVGITLEQFQRSIEGIYDRLGEFLLRRIPESKLPKA